MPLPSSSSSPSSTRPRPRLDQSRTLIPGLPNDVAALILSFVPYPQISRLKSTCKSWYAFLSSKTLISLRHKRNRNSLSHLLCIFPQDPSISNPYLFDPETLSWLSLPPMPCNPHVYGLCNFAAVALGPYIYVLGGSAFDTRSYPLDRPMPSSSAFRYSFVKSTWERLSPMLSPRGSFACAAMPGSNQIIVAGGGSRHTLFSAAGSRMSSVEIYDVERDEWRAMDGLPRFRAGCVGLLVRNEQEREFWVMGGYGGSRTVSGILPVDEYYRDAVVMELRNNDGGGKWRLVGDMWGQEERAKLGKIAAIDDDCGSSAFFMLDGNQILRYEMAPNLWQKESTLPRRVPCEKSSGFVALNGELHVMTLLEGFSSSDTSSQTRKQRKGNKSMMIQIYHPMKRTWRSIVSRVPFIKELDFRTSVMCTIRV
ncbi:PREDICTED: F-box/kelch-repeat protein OR23-like [Tarenaya hassleriana]|uniref:F-box/kelch-repeat protein OR23-like n=1 Tax=Tarenaya hassleriana TaxID=28532 RepID=UPI00053C7974|nr:PREDICTED: F-box/kelch-repeat protein OR23-like [Tarenaya hassleriana]